MSGSTSSAEMSGAEVDDAEEKEEKSEIYSHNMTEAMGAGKSHHLTTLLWTGKKLSCCEYFINKFIQISEMV